MNCSFFLTIFHQAISRRRFSYWEELQKFYSSLDRPLLLSLFAKFKIYMQWKLFTWNSIHINPIWKHEKNNINSLLPLLITFSVFPLIVSISFSKITIKYDRNLPLSALWIIRVIFLSLFIIFFLKFNYKMSVLM